MCVPDALSRNPNFPTYMESSPEEDDPYFPYVSEKPCAIRLPNGEDLANLIPTRDNDCHTERCNKVNFMKTVISSVNYDADTEDNLPDYDRPIKRIDLSITPKQIDGQYNQVHDKVIKSCTSNVTASQESVSSPVINNKSNSDKEKHMVETNITDGHSMTSAVSDCENKLDEVENSTSDVIIQDDTFDNFELFEKSDHTFASISQLQDNDTELKPIMDYIKTGELPTSQKLAREILLKHSDYAVIKGVLFHSRVAKSARVKTLKHFQLVVPQSMIKTILQLYHDSPLGAHGGIQDTIDKIKEHYYFTKLSTIVTDYVKSCPDCQKRKVTSHTKSKITAYPSPSGPFQVWEVDLYGPLPVTTSGRINM